MSPPDEKGNFKADISQDVINEALNSVRKHTGEQASDAPADVPTEGNAEANAAKSPVEVAALQTQVEQLKAQLEFSQAKGREFMEKLKEEHERVLRATADLENFKKRVQKERDEVVKFGSEKLLKDFLPVIDNFDRALDHAKSAADFDSLKQGLLMTRKLFEDTLARHGVKGFTAVGQPFDPRLHEAMQQVETADVAPNSVVMEVVRGYMLHDRLIRPALVSVAKAPSGGAGTGSAGGSPEQKG